MKRILLLTVLSLTGLFSVGCAYDGNTILAEVPAGSHLQTNAVPSGGKYALYHVTEFDKWGAPTKTEVVKTIILRENDKVGFNFEMAPDKQYQSDARSDVWAFAGSYRKNLGPIETLNDHYYWANPDDWNSYWASRPERVLIKRATLY